MAWRTDNMTPLTGRLLSDMIDHLMDMILRDDSRRLERYRSLEELWAMLGENAPTSGPQYLRYRMSKIFAAVCHCDPYDEDAYNAAVEEDKRITAEQKELKGKPDCPKKTLLDPAWPLAAWDARHHWEDLKGLLLSVRNDMLLKCNKAGNEDENYADDEIDEERANLHMYDVEKMLEYITVHQVLAPMRWELEQQVEANVQYNRPIKYDAEKLSDMAEQVEEMDEGRAKNALMQVYVRDETSRKTRSSGLTFAPPKQLKDYLQNRPFNLYHFQDKVKRTMAKWMVDTLGPEWLNKNSVLTQQGYRGDDLDQYIFSAAASAAGANPAAEDDDDSAAGGQKENESPVAPARPKRVLEEQDADDNVARKPAAKRAKTSPAPPADPSVANLREKRAHLRQEGTDPLAEAEAIASAAAAAPPPAARRDRDPNAPKKSAQSLAFSSDEEEDEEDEGVKLSAVPERARVRSPRGGDKDLVREKNAAGSTKRAIWTDEETNALRDAIRKHGKGNWSKMKSDPAYNISLAGRDGKQLKDKCRNLEKAGERF